MLYGIQRRIGNIGYIDVFGGIYYWEEKILEVPADNIYHYNQYGKNITILIGVRAGFAIDSFKNLKRMLKK